VLIGNFIVVNLFIAILLSSFDAHRKLEVRIEDRRGSVFFFVFLAAFNTQPHTTADLPPFCMTKTAPSIIQYVR
jgi:hypothetical protein